MIPRIVGMDVYPVAGHDSMERRRKWRKARRASFASSLQNRRTQSDELLYIRLFHLFNCAS